MNLRSSSNLMRNVNNRMKEAAQWHPTASFSTLDKPLTVRTLRIFGADSNLLQTARRTARSG